MLRARQISSMDVSPTIASLAIAGLISSTSSMRRYPGRNDASAIDHSPTAKPVVGGSRPWTCSIAVYSSSFGVCLKTNPIEAGLYVSSTAREKRRALALRKGEAGRRRAEGKVSARNSVMMSDSPSWGRSEDGESPGSSLGPPYTRYGTCGTYGQAPVGE